MGRSVILLNQTLRNIYASDNTNKTSFNYESSDEIEEEIDDLKKKFRENFEKLDEFKFSIGVMKKKISDDELFINKIMKEKEHVIHSITENDYLEIIKNGINLCQYIYDLFELILELSPKTLDYNLDPSKTDDTQISNDKNTNHLILNEITVKNNV